MPGEVDGYAGIFPFTRVIVEAPPAICRPPAAGRDTLRQVKIFLTGATGFIGSATTRRLTDQGHELTCLVRDTTRAGEVLGRGCTLVEGDLATPPSRLVEMIDDHEAVIHNAGIYEVGVTPARADDLKAANITGTANLLGAALEAGTPKVVYVSTCAVFGNTNGKAVDESYRRPDQARAGGPEFTSIYEETKYEAHRIALDLIAEHDLPCVIAQPAGVYGPHDHSSIGTTIHNFLDGKLPLIPFPDFGTGLAHVDDVATGLSLCLERGESGECYILTAGNLTMREIIETAARLTGREPPGRALPTGLLKALRPVGPLVGRLMGQPPNLGELISSADGVTFYADGGRARRELGFRPRDFETGLGETLAAEGRL